MTAPSTEGTVVALVLRRGEDTPNQVALRVLESGLWVEYDWADLVRTTARVADVLGRSGVTTGSTVGVVSGSDPRWALCVWAVQALGAVPVTVSCQADDAEIAAVAAHDPAVWILEGLEALDRVGADRVDPHEVLVLADVELPAAASEALRWDRDVLGAEGSDTERIAALAERVGATDRDALALVLPGEAGREFSHADLAAAAGDATRGLVLEPGDEYLTFLPPTWAPEAVVLTAAHPLSGAVVSVGSRVGGGIAEVASIQPTVLQAPAEWWDALADRLRRQAAEPAPLARRALTGIFAGEPGGGMTTKLARRSIVKTVGMQRLRDARAFGPVAEQTAAVFRGLGTALGDPLERPIGLDRSLADDPDRSSSNTPTLEDAP